MLLFHLKAGADLGVLLHQPQRDEDSALAVQDAHPRVLSQGCPAPQNLLHPPFTFGVVSQNMEQAGPQKDLQASAFGNYRAGCPASSHLAKLQDEANSPISLAYASLTWDFQKYLVNKILYFNAKP